MHLPNTPVTNKTIIRLKIFILFRVTSTVSFEVSIKPNNRPKLRIRYSYFTD